MANLWLEPWCGECAEEDEGEGRTWCRENVWESGCPMERCNEMPVGYTVPTDVLDLISSLTEETNVLRNEIERLQKIIFDQREIQIS